ncbi:UNVERIFIED_CONTAM: Berberine bridge enzyme-like 13 [Sesamum angustifolium]|uniref:Berberine bridge enzyme-like 13 n=1 Tax=Sesamum angustifolium TaxID=2727405 RepID=A0AAW2L669_9LAMI
MEIDGGGSFLGYKGWRAASFGVVTAWKIRLIQVPDIVTVFTVNRTLEQNATDLVHRWQYVADKFDRDLFVRILVTRVNSSDHKGKTTVQAAFNSVFLGKINRLLPLMQESFPELGLVKEDCMEKRWIEAVLYFLIFQTVPIPKHGLEGLWKFFDEDEAADAQLIFAPYGGRMSEIPESQIPFPHRAGNIYEIQHLAIGTKNNPRAAYLNYRDLDLGVNNDGNTSYEQASVWGTKYFKNNFKRLVEVKSKVDPSNFFRNEQSIPILST